jgi:hypothetical protein
LFTYLRIVAVDGKVYEFEVMINDKEY